MSTRCLSEPGVLVSLIIAMDMDMDMDKDKTIFATDHTAGAPSASNCSTPPKS